MMTDIDKIKHIIVYCLVGTSKQWSRAFLPLYKYTKIVGKPVYYISDIIYNI